MESIVGLTVPLSRIQSGKFCFRDNLDDSSLTSAIRRFGLLQPLTVSESGKKMELIGGHRRFQALKKLKQKKVSIFLLPEKDPKKLFLSALLLNHPLAYSDLDRCHILKKARKEFGFQTNDLQNIVLPLIGLMPSPKILNQYFLTGELSEKEFQMIRDSQLPFQGSFWIAKFSKADREIFRSKVLEEIRPTASQLNHLCEWLLDLTQIKKQSLTQILKGIRISPGKGNDRRSQTETFYQNVRALRFPDLIAKEKAFQQTVQSLGGKTREFEIRAPEHFEQEGFHLQAHIPNSKSLKVVIERLQDVQNQASALFDTLL